MQLPCFVIPFAAALVRASHYRDVSHKVKESIFGPPPGWIMNGPAPSDRFLQLKIALPQPHFPILIQHLWEVSDPDHERYGAYLSKEETHALMAPHPEALDAVNAWLSSYGFKEEDLHRSSALDWVSIRVPVALAEEMLGTKYQVYTHSDSGESIVRTTNYSLPESLHEHIDLIQPTTMFHRLRPLKSTLHWSTKRSPDPPSNGTIIGPGGNPVDASCNVTVTLDCIKQIYNAVGYTTSATNGNKIAMTTYYDQYVNNEDLQQFYKMENPAAYGSNYTFVSINGGLNNQSRDQAGQEAAVDSQLAFGLTYPTSEVVYSTGGYADSTIDEFGIDPYLDWINYVSSLDNLPQTIVNSYGDYEYTVPYSYATRVCDGYAELGVRGVSITFSSGDGAVGDRDSNPTHKCVTIDGTNRTMFLPTFPGTCPYVTTVGGVVNVPEIGAFFSGGGFSNYFSLPPYQGNFPKKFLEKLPPGTYEGLYNPDGRAVPDVAAQGLKIQVIYQGEVNKWGGTSTANPIFGAFVAMLNDARINADKPPMGFMNQWLYTRGRAGLNDITTGSNPGCGTPGFNATVGWDAVTGLGTPNFKKLVELAIGNHY